MVKVLLAENMYLYLELHQLEVHSSPDEPPSRQPLQEQKETKWIEECNRGYNERLTRE